MEVTKVPACLAKNLPEVIPGLTRGTAYRLVNEMYQDPVYSRGIAKPTERITIVNIQDFLEFMKVLEERRFKEVY